MKIKTADLTGRALDYAVAIANGNRLKTGAAWTAQFAAMGFDLNVILSRPLVPEMMHFASSTSTGFHFGPAPEYSTGRLADDIIDRDLIDTINVNGKTDEWFAQIFLTDVVVEQYGPTRRIAAMRAFVQSKLGDDINIPDELVQP